MSLLSLCSFALKVLVLLYTRVELAFAFLCFVSESSLLSFYFVNTPFCTFKPIFYSALLTQLFLFCHQLTRVHLSILFYLIKQAELLFIRLHL